MPDDDFQRGLFGRGGGEPRSFFDLLQGPSFLWGKEFRKSFLETPPSNSPSPGLGRVVSPLRMGNSLTFFGKVKRGAALVYVVIPGVLSAGYGIIDSAADGQINPFKSGAAAFGGVHHFSNDLVDGITKDEKGRPSTSLWAKGTKVVLLPIAVSSFAGAFVGNGATTVVTHVVVPAAKFAWNDVIAPVGGFIGRHISDDKPSAPPSAAPQPQAPQTRISYRVDDKRLG